MSILTNCPSCSRQLRVPDELLGKQVRCPQCSTTFTVQASGGTPVVAQAGGEYAEAPSAGMERPAGGGGAVTAPAACLLITAILNTLVGLYFLFNGIFLSSVDEKQAAEIRKQTEEIMKAFQGQGPAPQMDFKTLGAFYLILGVVCLVICLIVLIGSIQMLRLRSRGLAFAASILAMLPISPCCLLGLPFGIWAIMVLNRPEVKSAFH